MAQQTLSPLKRVNEIKTPITMLVFQIIYDCFCIAAADGEYGQRATTIAQAGCNIFVKLLKVLMGQSGKQTTVASLVDDPGELSCWEAVCLVQRDSEGA